MVRPRRVASASLVGGLLAAQVGAQAPTPSSPAVSPPQQPARVATNKFLTPIPTDPSHPDYHPGAHRTILRHNPLPRRTSYNSYYSTGSNASQGSAGYANPGGVGRYAEY